MASIFVTSREGEERCIELSVDDQPTLMEAIRNDGSFNLAAMCGGMLSCSTCHVYIAPEWAHKIPEADDEEKELLEASSYRTPDSRLSCQIRLDASLDELRVTIAPEE